MKHLLLTLSMLMPLSSSTSAQDSTDFETRWRGVVERAFEALHAEMTVGANLCYIEDGIVRGSVYFGNANQSARRSVNNDTIFHWASITKTFTAIAVMQLRDRGRLTLDDPIVKYLPEVKDVHNSHGPMSAITLRHLITHSSGFRGPTFPWGGNKPWHPHEPKEWSQVAAMMPYTEIHFEPGSKYSYSNPGFSMLGRVVEVVSGDDIEVYIHKNLLMPLGMTRSYFDHTPWHLLPHRSNNYTVSDDGRIEHGLDFDTGATTGNGGLNAPMTDMIRFVNFLCGAAPNETVLTRQTLTAMWQPVHKTGNVALKESMGMGFFVIDSHRLRIVGHTGSQKAFRSFFYLHPESRSAAIYAANTTRTGLTRTASSLGAFRRDVFKNLFAPNATTRRLPPDVEAVSLGGKPLRRAQPGSARLALAASLEAARAAFAHRATEPNAVWVGRRLAYLGRYREAIGWYEKCIGTWPESYQLRRHLGHRLISTRKIKRAIAVLEEAKRLAAPHKNRIEADGAPNSHDTPRSSSHGNIDYHLALAHYLDGDFETAARLWRECVTRWALTDDSKIAALHWLYTSLVRAGRTDDAKVALKLYPEKPDVIENEAYHDLVKLYRGEAKPMKLEGAVDAQYASRGYGLARWHLANGDEAKGRALLKQLAALPSWSSFGMIAAEADLAREGTR